MREHHRTLSCPCVLKQKPMCREGLRCWHFGNNKGTCDHCHLTGYVAVRKPVRLAPQAGESPK